MRRQLKLAALILTMALTACSCNRGPVSSTVADANLEIELSAEVHDGTPPSSSDGPTQSDLAPAPPPNADASLSDLGIEQADMMCPAGQFACVSATGVVSCTTGLNDQLNCGGCGIRCCYSCDKGVCDTLGACFGCTACIPPDAGCAGPIAVNLNKDRMNCGACNHVCQSAQVCFNGVCQ